MFKTTTSSETRRIRRDVWVVLTIAFVLLLMLFIWASRNSELVVQRKFQPGRNMPVSQRPDIGLQVGYAPPQSQNNGTPLLVFSPIERSIGSTVASMETQFPQPIYRTTALPIASAAVQKNTEIAKASTNSKFAVETDKVKGSDNFEPTTEGRLISTNPAWSAQTGFPLEVSLSMLSGRRGHDEQHRFPYSVATETHPYVMTTPAESTNLKNQIPGALRNEDFDELAMLSSTIQFAPGSRVLDETMRKALEPVRRILGSYSRPTILVAVATNEFKNKDRNRVLSQERGRAIIAQLVSQGLLFSHFSIAVSDSEEIPPNSHTVSLTITDTALGK
ncbi:MAG: hypothetical protein V3U76_18815 [Granulosicoccus sp.]